MQIDVIVHPGFATTHFLLHDPRYRTYLQRIKEVAKTSSLAIHVAEKRYYSNSWGILWILYIGYCIAHLLDACSW